MAVDWMKVKAEYINGDVTQRELATKYGVTLRQISNHATSEQWVQEREQHRNKLSTEIQQETDKKTVDTESEVLVIKSRLKLSFYKQIEKRLQSLDEEDGQEFRRLVQNYKDMCDIKEAGDSNTAALETAMRAMADIIEKPAQTRNIGDFEERGDK